MATITERVLEVIVTVERGAIRPVASCGRLPLAATWAPPAKASLPTGRNAGAPGNDIGAADRRFAVASESPIGSSIEIAGAEALVNGLGNTSMCSASTSCRPRCGSSIPSAGERRAGRGGSEDHGAGRADRQAEPSPVRESARDPRQLESARNLLTVTPKSTTGACHGDYRGPRAMGRAATLARAPVNLARPRQPIAPFDIVTGPRTAALGSPIVPNSSPMRQLARQWR